MNEEIGDDDDDDDDDEDEIDDYDVLENENVDAGLNNENKVDYELDLGYKIVID